jgi:hypothetical protein
VAGATGATGATGPTGPTGAAGQSVTTTTLNIGHLICVNGGTELVSASGTHYVCNGTSGGGGGSSPYGSGSAGDLTVAFGTTVDVATNGWAVLGAGLNTHFDDLTIAGTLIVPSGTLLRASGSVSITGTLQVATGVSEGERGVGRKSPGNNTLYARAIPSSAAALLLHPEFAAGGAGSGMGGGAGGGWVAIVAQGAISISGSVVANGDHGVNPQYAAQGVVGPGGGAGGIVVIASDTSVNISGTVQAQGGNGGNGYDGNGGTIEGGGGGGGGGIVHLLAPSAPSVGGATITLSGGSPGSDAAPGSTGSGSGGGACGGDGGTGAYSYYAGGWTYPRAASGSTGQLHQSVVTTPSELF